MITRDNYEEFFLLYTDNELSEAERHEVEQFVAEHPDLREEWEAMIRCKFSPDVRVAFPDREALLRPELEGSAYTGALLSYIDGELDPEERARIEAVILEQPRVAIEMAVLRQTISQPDPAIVFPGKDSLYRTDRNRRAVLLPWLRVGIAAAVVGAIALVFLLQKGQHTGTPPYAVTAKNDPSAGATKDSSALEQKSATPVTPGPIAALHLKEGQSKTYGDRPDQEIIHRRKRDAQTVVSDGQTAANPGTADPLVTIKKVDPVRVTNESVTAVNEPVTSVNALSYVNVAVQTGIPKDQSSFATQALQDEANDERINNFVADEPAAPGRTALRGIFRKLKRTLGKTADRDSDGNRQVTVGAFQVSID